MCAKKSKPIIIFQKSQINSNAKCQTSTTNHNIFINNSIPSMFLVNTIKKDKRRYATPL